MSTLLVCRRGQNTVSPTLWHWVRLGMRLGMLWCCMVMGWGAHAQNQDIRIAHIHSKTGPLEAYGKQTAIGLRMGLEYATNGTMKVAGKRLIVTESDDQGQPELGRTLLEAAYTEGKADIAIGPTASGVALAMLPVAQAHRKVLLVEPAVADAITGDRWNRYIFRTGRNSSQDAMANALALDREGVHMATLAQESAFGRDGVAAFKQAVRRASLVHEEYLPAQPGPSSDVAAAGKRLIDRLKDLPGRKVVWVLWAGGGHPVGMLEADFRAHGIEMSTGGNTLAAMVQFNRVPGMQGGTYYYYAFSRHPANLWLVTQHYLRYEEPPDMFTAGGFAAAMAVVTALERTKGDTTTEGLIRTMQGMAFETPKGTMRFRKEDHQALQSMYHFRVPPGAMPGRIPDLKLVREIKADEITVPVRNTAQR